MTNITRPALPLELNPANNLLPNPMVWVLGSTGMGHTSFGRAQQPLIYNGDTALLSEDEDSWNIQYSTTQARLTLDSNQNQLNNDVFTRLFLFEVSQDIGNPINLWSSSSQESGGYVKQGMKITITPQLKVDVSVPNIIQLANIEGQIVYGNNAIAVSRYADGTSAISVNGNPAVSMESRPANFTGGEMLGLDQYRNDWQQGLALQMFAQSISSVSGATLASLSNTPYQIVRTYAAVVPQVPGAAEITDVVKASSTQNSYQINYQVPASNNGTTDLVEFNITPNTAQGVAQFTDASIEGVMLVNLNPSTTYTLTSRAHNEIGYGPVSQPFVFTTAAADAPAEVDTSTKPNPPSGIVATAGDATVSVSFNAPSSDGGKPVLDYKVTGSDGRTATGATSPIYISAVNGFPVTYTVQARNVNGYSDLSSVSNSVTPLVAGAQPKPVVPGYTVKVYGDEPGDDFTTASQVASWTGTQSTVPQDQGPFIVFCRKTLDMTGQQFGPGWSEPANVGYLRPYPGMSRQELDPDGPRDITVNTPGVKLIMSNDARIKVGLFLEGFNIIQTGGRLIFRRDGWGQGGESCGWRNCRMLSTSGSVAIETGEYGNGYVCEDNLIIYDSASTGGVVNSFSGNVKRTTVVRRGAGAGNPAFTGNGVTAQDCVFSGCGGTPITAGGGGDHNYTDTPLTYNENGKLIYSPGQFFESATDLRPAAGSLMINGASQYSISKNDAAGKNRGTMPDAGAFQRTPATPLSVATVLVQEVDGSTYRISGTTTNNPTSGKLTLSPVAGSNSQTVGPVDLVLTPGAFSLEFDFVPPGDYNPNGTLVNDGGMSIIFGTAPIQIAGVGKLVYDTGGQGNATDPVDPIPDPVPTQVPPAITLLTAPESIMSGKEATVNATVDFKGAANGSVAVFALPQPSGPILQLGAATLNGSNASKTAELAKGKYKLRLDAVNSGGTTSVTTGEFTVQGLVGSFVLPAA